MTLYTRALPPKRDLTAATLDHIKPRAKGGSESKGNLVLACRQCNQEKGDASPEQWEAQCEQWIDSWTTTKRVERPEQPRQPANKPIPLEDTMYILKHGKAAWRQRYERDER